MGISDLKTAELLAVAENDGGKAFWDKMLDMGKIGDAESAGGVLPKDDGPERASGVFWGTEGVTMTKETGVTVSMRVLVIVDLED